MVLFHHSLVVPHYAIIPSLPIILINYCSLVFNKTNSAFAIFDPIWSYPPHNGRQLQMQIKQSVGLCKWLTAHKN